MAGSRQTNTFGEALQALMLELAKMKTMPDVDMAFVLDMETAVISKLREGIDGASATGASQVPGDPGLGQQIGMQGQGGPMAQAMGGGMPGGGMPGPPNGGVGVQGGMPGVGGGVPGVQSGLPMPNPDELRRILGQ